MIIGIVHANLQLLILSDFEISFYNPSYQQPSGLDLP